MVALSVPVRNARLNKIRDAAGSNPRLDIYDGPKPAPGGAVTTRLTRFTITGTFAPDAAGALLIVNAVTQQDPGNNNPGTAAWFRLSTSGGTYVGDGTVGTSDADLNLDKIVIGVGTVVTINGPITISEAASSPTLPPPATVPPAAFPSRLRADSRNIVDGNGYVMAKLKGFNMLVDSGFTWSQADFTSIAALGCKINRAVVFWDTFEPTAGTISTTYRDALDLHIARAEAAGLYTVLSIHLNVGRTPAWSAVGGEDAGGAYETERYYANGQNMTTYLANRYGNPAGAKYTRSVIGIGLNEPPVPDAIRNGTGMHPWLETRQRQMLTWARVTGGATEWIGAITTAWANATPTFDTYSTITNTTSTPASPTAYDAVGGNVVFDFHDYNAGMTSATTTDDGRLFNGIVYPTTQGGTFVLVEDPTRTYASTATRQAQMKAFIDPFKRFSIAAGIPLMMGEWGFPDGDTLGSENAWIADQMLAWADAGNAIEIHWNYDVSTQSGANPWAARPAGAAYRSSVVTWMAG